MVHYHHDIDDKRALCACQHPKRNHAYLILIGDNSGRCLSRGCDCSRFEEM